MDRSEQKKLGMEAAKTWRRTALAVDIVKVGGYDFDYQLDTLDQLREQGFDVPSSSDFDFSHGFWKNIKSHVTHKIYQSQRSKK